MSQTISLARPYTMLWFKTLQSREEALAFTLSTRLTSPGSSSSTDLPESSPPLELCLRPHLVFSVAERVAVLSQFRLSVFTSLSKLKRRSAITFEKGSEKKY